MTEEINPYLLETKGIAKSYGSVVALTSVDLVVRHGEIHALLGANGAGKSTLVKILAGVQPADAGELHVDGKPAYFHSPADAMAAGISTVFHDLYFILILRLNKTFVLAVLKNRSSENGWNGSTWVRLIFLRLCVNFRWRRCGLQIWPELLPVNHSYYYSMNLPQL